MTQPPCQVRLLTPASDRFERLRARLDQAEPGLLPPPDAREGDALLIDHQPAADCLPDERADAFVLPRVIRGAPEAAEAGQIGEPIGEAVAQTREIARGLYPPDLTNGRLPDGLARLALHFQTVHDTFCTFEEDGCERLPDLPRPSLLHLYRIAREAASNAHRHGRADAVAIRLACRDGAVTLTVRDNGRGFDPAGGEEEARQSGLGLHRMHYRAHLLGGTLTVRPGLDGAGTLVTCVFDPALDQDRAGGRTA